MVMERLLVGIGLVTLLGSSIPVEASDSTLIILKQVGRYNAGASTSPDEPRAEISAFDPASQRLFSINLNRRPLDVLDLSAPETPVLVQTVPLGNKPNSVAVSSGVVAIALEGPQKTDPGSVKFFNASDRAVSGSSNTGIIHIRNWPVLGMYQLDSIAAYRVKGTTYLVTTNEGDARDYIIWSVASIHTES